MQIFLPDQFPEISLLFQGGRIFHNDGDGKEDDFNPVGFQFLPGIGQSALVDSPVEGSCVAVQVNEADFQVHFPRGQPLPGDIRPISHLLGDFFYFFCFRRRYPATIVEHPIHRSPGDARFFRNIFDCYHKTFYTPFPPYEI